MSSRRLALCLISVQQFSLILGLTVCRKFQLQLATGCKFSINSNLMNGYPFYKWALPPASGIFYTRQKVHLCSPLFICFVSDLVKLPCIWEMGTKISQHKTRTVVGWKVVEMSTGYASVYGIFCKSKIQGGFYLFSQPRLSHLQRGGLVQSDGDFLFCDMVSVFVSLWLGFGIQGK